MEIMSYFATESAEIFGVLRDFHLLHGFTERGAITCAVFTDNSDLLGALGL